MKNCIYQKHFLKNGCKCFSLDLPLAINYENHRKSLACFCHLAPLIWFFFTKRQSQKDGGMAQCSFPLNTRLIRSNNSIVMN